MPLKHAKMSVSGTAARSPLNTWQPDQVYAVFEQTCHLNMPTWAWAEQLHAPRWIPDSQIKSMQICNKHATWTCQHGRELNSCTLPAWTATSRPLRCAETALQNTIEVRTRATQIAAPKPDLDAQAEKRRFWSTFPREFEKEHHQCKNEAKSAAKAPFATFMHPLQYDLRLSAAKNNSIPQTGAAARNFHAAIPLRSAETALQNTIEVRTRATQTAAPKPDLDAQAEERRFWSTFPRKFEKENHQCQNEEKICCQNTIRNFHAAIIIQFMTFNCKKKYSARSRSSEEPWRSHSTAICTDCNAQHNRIATHYCRTHRFDAPVPPQCLNTCKTQ